MLPVYCINGVNIRKKRKKSRGSGATFIKMLVVSFLLHAAVIYLTPSVNLLSPIPQYIELETLLIESETPDPPEAQATGDEHEGQGAGHSEVLQETIVPLSEYEPAEPEMVSEQFRENPWNDRAMQHSFRLPEPVNPETPAMDNQKLALKPVDPEDSGVMLLPARAHSRISPEAVTSKSERDGAQAQETVMSAEDPYAQPEETRSPLVVQEDLLPVIKANAHAVMLENAPQPPLSVSAAVQPRLTEPAESPVKTFNIRQPIPETPTTRFSPMKASPESDPAEEVTQVEVPDRAGKIEHTMMTASEDLDPEFRPEYSLILPKSQSQDLLPESRPVSKTDRQPSALGIIESGRPDSFVPLSKIETKLTAAPNFFIATQDEQSLKTPEIVEFTPVPIMTAVEDTMITAAEDLAPEFRSEHTSGLLKSEHQNLLPESPSVSKVVRQPLPLPPVFSVPIDLHPKIKTPEALAETKSRPASADDSRAIPVEPLATPIFETRRTEDASETPYTRSPLRQAGNLSEQSSSPIRLSAQVREERARIETPVDVRNLVRVHQEKAVAQKERAAPKMTPIFQSVSSLQAPVFIVQRRPKEGENTTDEKDSTIAFSRNKEINVFLSQKIPEYSYPAHAPSPRIRQVLSPQKAPVAAPLPPPLASQKMTATLTDRFPAKKPVENTRQYVVKAETLDSQQASAGRPAGQPQTDTLPEPFQVTSRSKNSIVNAPAVHVSAFKPVQRTGTFGGSVEPGSFAIPILPEMFARKDTSVPETVSPQKPVEIDDAVTRITEQEAEEEALAPTIEGPASTRQVISQPVRLPEIDLDVEVTIRLQFWVLPDGTVGEVIPLQRGDVRLERAAIQYLKSWRFTPLASGNQKMWGIIPITYKLQ